MEQIPYIAHEADMTRMERMNRRLWITNIILIVMLLATNVGWIYYENSFEDVVVEQDSGEGGNNNFVGNDGDITNN